MRRSIAQFGSVALLVAAISVAGPAAAGDPTGPLYVKNASPVAGLLGLPAQRSAAPMKASAWQWDTHASVANHYIVDQGAQERLNLDGETARLALSLRYAMTDRLDVQLEVPWLDHSGGSLDSVIDSWHDLWSMPDGGRDDVPRNVLAYQYFSTSDNFGLVDDVSGLGDVSASVTYAMYEDAASSAAISLGYKLATGDELEFLGSGSDDVYLLLRFSGAHLADLPLSWHGQMGYLRAGEIDVLRQSSERDLWFAGLALEWQFNERWFLLGQLDAHAAPVDSELPGLGDNAVLATVGVRWHLASQWSLELAVVEDIAVETAPDVTFQGSLRYRSAP